MALVDLKSDLTWYGDSPSVNYFPDETGAKGFTDNMLTTQFSGVQGEKYTYPSGLVRKFNALNLQSNSYNTNDTIEFRQPFIVRGMQRPGQANGEAQRWGSTIDDGMIRGGAATMASRIAADVSRITKFLGTVKGKLWITKQFGLGRSNPKVETITGSTRTHLGVTSLLSVAGSPLGLHFTRHGIPWVNQIDDYGSVQNTKRLVWNAPLIGNRLINLKRELMYDLPPVISKITSFIQGISSTLTGFDGQPILTLSGIGGPNSVYGVGLTTLRRHTNTRTDAINMALKSKQAMRYYNGGFGQWYASKLKGNTKNDNDGRRYTELHPRDARDIDSGLVGPSLAKKIKTYNAISDVTLPTILGVSIPTISISGGTPGANNADLSTSTSKIPAYPDSPNDSINQYITLAYNKIPKNTKNASVINDFRNELNTNNNKSILGNSPANLKTYYQNNNLQDKYGFGNLGKVGADKTNPNSFGKDGTGRELKGADYTGTTSTLVKGDFRGDKVNATDIVKKLENVNNVYTDTKDLIKFFFEDGEKGNNVMLFRAIITGLTDSFSPGWDKVDIMGRPDGAYIYTSYERTVSFNFTVAAMSRAEMIPLWRKLNYLSTYTMPNLQFAKTTKGKVSGPFMRLTVGDMYNRVPGFISALSYTVADESSWDIAEVDGKQLPMVVEVAMSYTIVSDYRPQLNGRAFGIYEGNDDWLSDATPTTTKPSAAPVTSAEPAPNATTLPANTAYTNAYK